MYRVSMSLSGYIN